MSFCKISICSYWLRNNLEGLYVPNYFSNELYYLYFIDYIFFKYYIIAIFKNKMFRYYYGIMYNSIYINLEKELLVDFSNKVFNINKYS